MADLFLPAGATIGTVRGKDPAGVQRYTATTPETWPGLRVAILVDEHTASSAELFAAALQEHDRAVIVGTPTYGKGIVQTTIPLDTGVAVRLTTARW